MKHWGIRRRVLFLALMPASAIAALLAFYFMSARFDALEQALRERGLAVARQLAPASEFGVFSGNREVLQRLAEAALREADVVAVTLTGADGQVLARSGTGTRTQTLFARLSAADQAVLEDGRLLAFAAPILQSQTELEPFLEEEAGGRAARRVLGRVYLEVSRDELIRRKNRLLLDGALIVLLGLGMGALLAYRMSRDVTQPVLRLTEAVQGIGKGDLGVRVAAESSGELGVLEAGINAMADRLQSARENLEARIAAATAELAEKKEEAERANAAKSRFLAAASHDLRQPMHALGLFVAELRSQTARSADLAGPEAGRIVNQIEASVSAMEDLLDALLDISRLDAGVLVPRLAEFPVARLLERMENDWGRVARARDLRFRAVASRAWIRSDPLLLERLLQNLVSNAVRYTQKGGIVVGCRRRGDCLQIGVWDSGIGIAPELQRDIFQEFFQVANVERDRSKGLGLGLAIVERIGRLLGHPVWVRSAPGAAPPLRSRCRSSPLRQRPRPRCPPRRSA